MDNDYCQNNANLDRCNLLYNPRVSGFRILSLAPENGWEGPTICVQNNGGWEFLPVELIKGEPNEQED